jgi:DNA-binding transcriptional LysR family regulator
MRREDLVDLNAFAIAAEERNFTRAAARLGISQSALSHAVRRLETRLGVRLLARTTRSVAPTEAGERLLGRIGPGFEEIAAGLASLSELRDRPAGTIRISAAEHPALTLLWPAIRLLAPAYPEIRIEVTVDNAFSDIVAGRFEAGVRLGEQVAKEMIAVRIGPDMRMAVVGSPAYFATHDRPATPKDLARHDCINLRLETYDSLYAWEFERDGEELNVRVDGQLTFNSGALLREATLAGLGLAYLPEDMVAEDLAGGALVRVLEKWCEPFAGYHLYFPSRRQQSPAFAVLLDALRYRAADARVMPLAQL